jgi:Antitoxin VbhA
MKKISKQMARSKAVANVLASLRIEQLTPSDFVVKGLDSCTAGQKTTTELVQEVIRHHSVLIRQQPFDQLPL